MNPNEILKNHEPFIVRMAHHYRYLGYEDIYNQTYLFILEAYHNHHPKPEDYASNHIRKYAKGEVCFRRSDHYGLNPGNIFEEGDYYR